MKKTVVHVPFDEEKLSAARLYMAQKELSFEEEMEKAAETFVWEICSCRSTGIH